MAEKIDELFIEVGDNFDEVSRDLKKLGAQFDKFGNEATASAQKADKGFSKLNKTLGGFGRAVAGGAIATAGAKLAGVLGDSLAASNRLEQSFISLEASIKRLDRSVDLEQAKKQVLSLAEDGFLSVEQASEAFRTSLESTQSAAKSFELVNAVKQIAAIENITGDGAESTRQFFQALLTGSTEVIDNASPRFKALARELGGFAKVTTDAATKQEFFNRIIKEASAVGDSYEQFLDSGAGAQARFANQLELLNASIGESLQPLLSEVLSILTPLVTGFSDFVKSLNPTQKAILGISAALAAAIPIVVGLVVALGPISLIAVAVTAAVGALGLGIGALADSTNRVSDATKGSVKRLNDLQRELDNTNKDSKRYKEILAEIGKEERKIAKESAFLKKLGAENLALNEQIRLLEVNAFLKKTGGTLDEFISGKRGEVEDARGGVRAILNRRGAGAGLGDTEAARALLDRLTSGTSRKSSRTTRDISALRAFLADQADLEAALRIQEGRPATAAPGVSLGGATAPRRGGGAALPQFPSIDPGATLLRDIAGFAQELEANLAKVNNVEDALLKAAIKRKATEEELNKIIERAAQERANAEERASRQLIERVSGAVSGVAGGLQAFAGASSASGALGGIGQISGAFDPTAGAAIGAGASVLALGESLFGDSAEELARQEEKRRQILARQTALLEQQLTITRALESLERERRQLANDAAETQIRINNLTIEDEQERLAANRDVLQSLATELGQQTGVDVNAGTVGAEITALNEKAVNDAALGAAIQAALASLAGSGGLNNEQLFRLFEKTRANLVSARQAIGPNVSSAIESEYANVVSNLENIFDSDFTKVKDDGLVPDASVKQGQVQESQTAIESILGDTAEQQENLDELLGVLEQIQDVDEQIAGGSDNSLQLQDGRALSFVDIGAGGVQSLGQFVSTAQPITPDQLALPEGAGAVALATSNLPSFQERQALALEDIVQLERAAVELLGLIAQNTNSTTGFASQDPQAIVTEGLTELRSLAI